MDTTFKPRSGIKDRCRAVRRHIAKALVGQSVDLMANDHTIVHGVVTAVMTEAGVPKLLVGGSRYDLNQILTAMPATLDGSVADSPFTYHLSTTH